jgi:hypothetical protein
MPSNAGDRLSDAAKRRACDHRFLEIAAHDAGAVRALGLDAARRNRVDPDFSWTQFRGEPACYCIHRAFGPGIDRGRRLSRACNRAYVDDAAAIRPEVLDRFFGGEDRPEHIDVELTMELVLGDVFQRHEFVDAGIVHQHVERAKGLFGFVK